MPIPRPVVLFDCDGPLLGFTEAVCSTANQKLPPDQHLHPHQVTQWDVFGLIKDVAVRAETRATLEQAWWWETLPVTPGAREGLELVRSRGFDIVIVTSPWESCKGWEHARRHMLHKHFGVHRHDVIVCARKDLVQGAALVDDKPSHVREWKASNPLGFAALFDLPHNQDAAELQRFTWEPSQLDGLCAVAEVCGRTSVRSAHA